MVHPKDFLFLFLTSSKHLVKTKMTCYRKHLIGNKLIKFLKKRLNLIPLWNENESKNKNILRGDFRIIKVYFSKSSMISHLSDSESVEKPRQFSEKRLQKCLKILWWKNSATVVFDTPKDAYFRVSFRVVSDTRKGASFKRLITFFL